MDIDLDHYLDSKLIRVVEDILQNPSVMDNNHRSFSVAEILDMPSIDFEIQSQHLFAFMSSAFSPGKKEIDVFLERYPATNRFMQSLGPNRRQYCMILFNIIRKFDPLTIQIIQDKINKMVNNDLLGEIIDIYENNPQYRYRKAIYLASPPIIQAKIIMIDQDPRIQRLRYE